MEASVNFRSRKRKLCSSSNPFNGAFTRSKSQIHLHRSRSGRSWPDNRARKPFQQSHLMLNNSLKKPRNIDSPILENEDSIELSIKDLRARARRVFSPTSVVEGEGGECGMGIDFGEEDCIGASKVLGNSDNLDLEFTNSNPNSDSGTYGSDKEKGNGREGMDPDSKYSVPDTSSGNHGQQKKEEICKNLDLEFKSSYPGTNSGFNGSDKEEGKGTEVVDPGTNDSDPGTSSGSQGQQKREEDLDLDKLTPPMENNDGDSNIESKNGTLLTNKMVRNSSHQRKVFKTPCSFSYRRLLPFLMDMAKDDSCISKIEVVDVEYSCNVQNSNKMDFNPSSVLQECFVAEHKHTGQHSQCTSPMDKGDIPNTGVELPVTDGSIKGLDQIEESVMFSGLEQRNNENVLNGVDESIEECTQATPPDDTILSKRDIDDNEAQEGTGVLQTENQIPKKSSNEITCCKSLNISKKSLWSPARKSDSISKTKSVLNPCSRLKIFKTSSFSYRRLLPFLMDVAKTDSCTSNVDECPKFKKDTESDSLSVLSPAFLDSDAPRNKTDIDDTPSKQNAEEQEPNSTTIEVPLADVSSDDISPNLLTPSFSSGYNSSDEKLNSASKPDMHLSLQIERASEYENITYNSSGKLEGELHNNDMKSCNGKVNWSAEKLCSTINMKSLPRETMSEVSQSESANNGKDSMALDLDYHKGKTELTRSVSLNESSSQVHAFEHLGNQSKSPTKGILKRNPRGCRGLCSCLNCSSFRLHAERAFEFSRNQMLDTEEVTERLINQMTQLRNLLEAFVVDGSDLAGIKVDQVKEACYKALKTEQLAKQCLSQMNDDLNIHCRLTPLQRPRVTFSRYAEEKATAKTNISTSP